MTNLQTDNPNFWKQGFFQGLDFEIISVRRKQYSPPKQVDKNFALFCRLRHLSPRAFSNPRTILFGSTWVDEISSVLLVHFRQSPDSCLVITPHNLQWKQIWCVLCSNSELMENVREDFALRGLEILPGAKWIIITIIQVLFTTRATVLYRPRKSKLKFMELKRNLHHVYRLLHAYYLLCVFFMHWLAQVLFRKRQPFSTKTVFEGVFYVQI